MKRISDLKKKFNFHKIHLILYANGKNKCISRETKSIHEYKIEVEVKMIFLLFSNSMYE